jgi:hypothetical protein
MNLEYFEKMYQVETETGKQEEEETLKLRVLIVEFTLAK